MRLSKIIIYHMETVRVSGGTDTKKFTWSGTQNGRKTFMNIKKEELIQWTKIALVAPIALVWDIIFWCITKLHKGASWVDLVVGEKIDEFLRS